MYSRHPGCARLNVVRAPDIRRAPQCPADKNNRSITVWARSQLTAHSAVLAAVTSRIQRCRTVLLCARFVLYNHIHFLIPSSVDAVVVFSFLFVFCTYTLRTNKIELCIIFTGVIILLGLIFFYRIYMFVYKITQNVYSMYISIMYVFVYSHT